MAVAPAQEDEDARLQLRQAAIAKIRERKNMELRTKAVNYMAVHREQLEKVLQLCMNEVFRHLPVDPYALMLEHVSGHTRAGLEFREMRFLPGGVDAGGQETLSCEVAVSSRSSPFPAHRCQLSKATVARGLGAAVEAIAFVAEREGKDAEALAAEGRLAGWAQAWSAEVPGREAAEALSSAALVDKMRAVFGACVAGVPLLQLQQLDDGIRIALVGNLSLQDLSGCPAEDDLLHLANQLGIVVLEAAGAVCDLSAMEAMKAAYGAATEKLPSAPQLCCREDLAEWQHIWPEILLPALVGSTARRRLCVGVTVWAATLEEVAGLEGVAALEHVDFGAFSIRQSALESGQGDDEDPPVELDEYAPPLNAVSVAAQVALALAAKAAGDAGPNMSSGGDFKASLAQLRGALEALAPGYLKQQLAGLREDRPAKLADLQQQGCIYTALDPDADAALDEEGKYTFADGGEGKTAEELVDYYEELCTEEPLLRLLIAPFASRDDSAAGCYDLLEARLAPLGVVVVRDRAALPSGAPVDPDATMPPDQGLQASAACVLRNLHGSVLGLAAQYLRQPDDTAPQLQNHGVYDFGTAPPSVVQSVGGWLDVSMSLPETSRRLVLPQPAEGVDVLELLRPVEDRLRDLVVVSYRVDKPPDDGKPPRKLTEPQFRRGLRKLGFEAEDEGPGPITGAVFRLLDCMVSKSGLISMQEMDLLKYAPLPLGLEELDDFRLWAVSTSLPTRRSFSKQPSSNADAASSQSAFVKLWDLMDRTGERAVNFAQFKAALKKLRYPAALKDDGRLFSLFLSFDRSCTGFVAESEFLTMGMFSARYQLKRVGRVKDFLESRFGSLKSAFRAMDEHRSGCLSSETFAELMDGQQQYPIPEDVKSTYRLLDKDGTCALTPAHFETLGNWTEDEFLAEVKVVRDQLISAWGDLDKAWQGIELRLSPPNLSGPGSQAASRPHTGTSHATASVRSKRAGQGLGALEFEKGLKKSGYRPPKDSPYDYRMIFNFLDCTHRGKLMQPDFAMLGRLEVSQELEDGRNQMSKSMDTFRDFVLRSEMSEEPTPAEEAALEAQMLSNMQPDWGSFFEDLRIAVHDDD
eukprot:TRINITY_DN25322_c0_g2_i1.p1 TRINITY_DN25322_c0_g2~~TRINITY_DN25322_c0_g2_i1.p1  ORF type:complete len:1092 (+),score=318.24 TRINITY_DN25322_c0_g2_i1:83-3358(+)